MEVKELIEQLQKLDQERNIWVRYDGVYFYAPIVDKDTVDECDAKEYSEQGIKEGDYTV